MLRCQNKTEVFKTCSICSPSGATAGYSAAKLGSMHRAAEAGDDLRPEKRQRLEQQYQNDLQEVEEDDGPPPGPPPPEQVKAALQKIAAHISNSAKFSKSSELLRRLMDALDKSHSDDFFAAVKAAFTHPEHCIDPLLRKDYIRLVKAVNLRSEVFSKRQQAQLEVYNILALTQNELFTDDSFMFNKVVAKIKSSIASLPDADEEQEAAWLELFPEEAAALGISAAPPAAAAAAVSCSKQGVNSQQQKGPAAAAAEEADPFGLDAFLAQAAAEDEAVAGPSSSTPEATAAAAPPKPRLVWDSVSCMVMRKQALLSCIDTAKTHQHKLAWARTSVELLIEDVAKPAAQGGLVGKFVGGQKQQLQELLKFVNAERAARRSGVNRRPGGKGTGEYQTTFEKARAEWGSKDWVSARGKVGSGDAKQQSWLG